MSGSTVSSARPAGQPWRARRRPHAAYSRGSASSTNAPVYAAEDSTATGLGYSVLPVAAWELQAARNRSAAATDLRREPGARDAALRLAPVLWLPATIRVLPVRRTHCVAPGVRHAATDTVVRPNTVFAAATTSAGSLDTTGASKRNTVFSTWWEWDAADPAGARRAVLVPTTATSSTAAAGLRRVVLIPATAAPPTGLRDVVLVAASTIRARARRLLRVAASTDGGAVELGAS